MISQGTAGQYHTGRAIQDVGFLGLVSMDRIIITTTRG